MKRYTIRDVARACGVSVSTVSRVLNGRPDVSESVREQVLEAVKNSGYIPNNSARNLVISHSDCIALIVRGFANPFFSEIIRHLEAEIYGRGYTLHIQQIGICGDELQTAAALIPEKRLCGILFLGGRFNYTRQEVEKLQVPFLCCSYTNCFGDLDPDMYSSVSVDDEKLAYDAVSRFCQAGHRRIAAIIEREDGNSISQLRFQGYKKALAEYGIPFSSELVECTGSFNMEDAHAASLRLCKKTEFSALFVISDTLAMAAMRGLADCGKRIPEDCALIGVDGLEMTRYCIPSLATMKQPALEMAKKSAEILDRLIRGDGSNEHLLLPTEFREGASFEAKFSKDKNYRC